MPRYHFNVFNGRSWPGATGTMLRGAREARLEAIHLAGTMLQQHAERVSSSGEWRMEVTDRAGLVLFQISFSVVASPMRDCGIRRWQACSQDRMRAATIF